MKILCVIDSLGSGGAQRQMVNLAGGLKANGHQVELFVYYPEHDFFRSVVDQSGIRVHAVRKGCGFSWKVLWRLMCLLRREYYDSMIAFLGTPNIYAELARVAKPETNLIVSERNSHQDDTSFVSSLLRRVLHMRADVVTTNSYAHATWLKRYPWLKKKTKVVYNGYSIIKDQGTISKDLPSFGLLLVGRVAMQKNGLRLVEALVLFHRKHGYVPSISWAGKRDNRPEETAFCRKLDNLLEQHPHVKRRWTWLGERSDVLKLLYRHYALIHPSLYEGLPNVVCEALVAGRPVLASRVCDHPLLVEDGKRGFLFDPHDPHSIVGSIERLAALSRDEWVKLSSNARSYAEANLSINRMVNAYEVLLTELKREVQ